MDPQPKVEGAASGETEAVLPARRLRLPEVAGYLTLTQVGIAALGFITGPIQARALGPDGRGMLAAILVPVTLAPFVAGLGVGTYVQREVARGTPIGTLIGSVAPILGLPALGGVLAAGPIAGLIAGGRATVDFYIRIGFYLLPLALVGGLLMGIAYGLQRWWHVIAAQLLPPVIGVFGVVLLFVLDRLTVASAAILALSAGLTSLVPLLLALEGVRRVTYDPAVAAASIRFGLKAWIGGAASLANGRLDQLLMTRLVTARELGLYAVAVNTVGFSMMIAGSSANAIFPRTAGGDYSLPARATRTSITIVAMLSGGVAIVATPLVKLLYGSAFMGAAPMIWILLVAGVPLTGALVLSAGFTGSGRPAFSAVSELIALSVTIPGLLLALPLLAGVGAALVSLLAYSLSFGFLVLKATRHFETSVWDFLIIQRGDISSLRSAVREQLRRK